MLWGYSVLVWYIDGAYINNGRYVHQLSDDQLLLNTLFGFIPVFNNCVLFFRLKPFADDQLTFFKRPVKNLAIRRYITIRAN